MDENRQAAAVTKLSADDWRRAKELFQQASALSGPECARLLAAADVSPAVRAEVESLLAAAADSRDFLEQPAVLALRPPDEHQAGDLPAGSRIGIYRVLKLLGRGGTGEVYLVERADGLYEQKVALKLLRAEAAQQWDRFNAERQILARLEHPGIARLLDGGVSPEGRPYTVVEYVEGTHLLEHCDQQKLPLRERLELMLQVCEAVAYAHAHLVVHRDIKPPNLLINTKGRVKLLDFGVAKLLDPGAVPTGGHTWLAPFTPDYAAPEQIEGKAVTTATDVYSIGVTLFEVLTGDRPWRAREMPLALAVEHLLKHTAQLPSRAANASPRAPVPSRLLAGDLDAIVAKALRKEPQHRYPTVEALAEDLRRHLNGAPVAAREGARLYVAGRWLRRHRWGVVAGAAVALVLIGAAASYFRAREHRAQVELRAAQAELETARRLRDRATVTMDFLTLMLRDGGDSGDATVRDALAAATDRVFEEYGDQPDVLGQLVSKLDDLYFARKDYQTPVPMMEKFLAGAASKAEAGTVAEVRYDLAMAEYNRGDRARALELLKQAQAVWEADRKQYAEILLTSRTVQAAILRAENRLDDGIAVLRTAIAETTALHGADDKEMTVLLGNLALHLYNANRGAEAEAEFRKCWQLYERRGETDTPDALGHLGNWAGLVAYRGEVREAEQRYRELLPRRFKLYGGSAPLASNTLDYARLLVQLGRAGDALDEGARGRAMALEFTGPKSPLIVKADLVLADARLARGDVAGAEKTFVPLVALIAAQWGPAHVFHGRTLEARARLRIAQKRAAEADTDLQEAESVLRKAGVAGEAPLGQVLVTRANLRIAQGRAMDALAPLDEALKLREKFTALGTWPQAEIRALQGMALIETGDTARGRQQLQAATADLQAQLGEAHPLTRAAESRLAQ